MEARFIFTCEEAEKGFTLMELVVCVLIISIMTAVLLPHLLGAGKRTEVTACEENQRLIRGALTEYYMVNHSYPNGNSLAQLTTLRDSEILQSIPKDPSGGNYVINDVDMNNVTVSCDVHGMLGNDS